MNYEMTDSEVRELLQVIDVNIATIVMEAINTAEVGEDVTLRAADFIIAAIALATGEAA
jgi:hypothetical protein